MPKENNRQIQVTTIPFQDTKGRWLCAEVNVDITDRKMMEEKLRRDALTGLANRSVIMERLEHAISHGRRKPSDRFFLLFIDLDDFKKVNDGLGHAQGDKLLKESARRIAGCLRPGDTLARLGGDEFSVLLELMPEPESGERVARRIMSVMQEPFLLAGQRFSVTASIGICSGPEGTAGADEYLRNADAAMYRAKKGGKNRFEFFSSEISETMLERMIEETRLLEAIREKQFSIHYQPVVELPSERIIGYEALLRWHHPEKGLTGPGEFIPLAEETGLIIGLGEWVLEESCRQQRADGRKGENAFPLQVNISPKQLQDRDLVSKVKRILEKTGFPPRLLYFEITETVLMSENTLDVIVALKRLGIKVIIDDFGAGHASILYLNRYPVDGLKIDRSLIAEMPRSGKGLEIVKAIIILGKTLQIKVTAEGVETREQARTLESAGCDFAQGFLYGKPEPRLCSETGRS